MKQEIKGASNPGVVPPATVMQEFNEPASGKVQGPTLSAYTLALRDPGLFDSLYLKAPQSQRLH